MSGQEINPFPNPVDAIMDPTVSRQSFTSNAALKRRASPSFEGLGEDTSRKRIKEEQDDSGVRSEETTNSLLSRFNYLDEMAEELQCGCCSELVYRPVIVMPCQHFFCGSCCVLWIRNGGTNCPACRGLSTVVAPFRALQGVIDTLLRAAPHKARTERERQQADEIYKTGNIMRIPAPREASPEPNLNLSAEYARPCPHCAPNNAYGWRCPQPIPDPSLDLDHAWHLEDGTPPGHAHCGNCENLLAVQAPTTTKCDFCQVAFCGIGVQGRCLAAPLISQHPHGLADVGDLIQSADVYECFDSNAVEVDIMLDYLSAQRLTPRHIYREIVAFIQSQPRGFSPLIEQELFTDIHGVSAASDLNSESPRNIICRLCATEVLLWGLRDWWVRERQKGFLEEAVTVRQDCPDGSGCERQREHAHAREFNHIITPLPEPQISEPTEENFTNGLLNRERILIQGETIAPPAPEVTDTVPLLEFGTDAPTSSTPRPTSQSFVIDTMQDIPFLNFAIRSGI
ncbi:hypothetical protein BDZ94DRAFT_1257154 [Collybia nuda]|uniref:RING-type domain-containing protein n=1 Tax=Collybia nuda TaxID=64659 RepID=A0A9P5Y8J5_9AGAR|nr:hypothetical protein BDZ94DRAFT_1257154 [Collybia nuda]